MGELKSYTVLLALSLGQFPQTLHIALTDILLPSIYDYSALLITPSISVYSCDRSART